MRDYEAIGRNIKHFREKHGLTQAELAQRLFVSFQAVSAWERGLNLPDLENVMHMAEIFGTGVDRILADHDEVLFVGIDGGGSKTEFCAVLADGTVKKRIITEGANPNDVGIDRSCAVVHQGLESILTSGQTIQTVFAGVAGTSTSTYRAQMEKSLQNRFRGHFYVDSDAANVLSMGDDPDNSAMVICGTGSSVFVRKNGVQHRIGGWGQLFDESGSAYDIGKDAVRHTLAVVDTLEQESLVSVYVERVLGCTADVGLGMLYEKGRPYIARLAEQVAVAYAEGDGIAKKILEKNAQYLGMLIAHAKKKYNTSREFMAVGGFFENCLPYRAMVESYADCTLVQMAQPPVYGACIEAVRRSGYEIDEGFKERFEESYRRILC